MKIKNYCILLLVVIITSCKTVYINKQQQKIAASPLELATIGKTTPNVQINNFEINAIPRLSNKLRLIATVLPFNKSGFKAYTKAAILQGKRDKTIAYIDSLTIKPTFVNFKIADKVTLLNELNKDGNSPVFNYLKNTPNAKIITSISIVFDALLLDEIKQAETMYLSNAKHKKYVLELYKNNKPYKTIDFSTGVTFTYQISSFCWKKNYRNQIKLANIVNHHTDCKNDLFKNYPKIKKKKSSFKF